MLLFSKNIYVSVKFYLYQILNHSVIYLLINIFLDHNFIFQWKENPACHQALCKAICKSENVEQTVISFLVKEKPR